MPDVSIAKYSSALLSDLYLQFDCSINVTESEKYRIKGKQSTSVRLESLYTIITSLYSYL